MNRQIKCVYKFIICKNHAQEGYSTSVQFTCFKGQLDYLFNNFKKEHFPGEIRASHIDITNTVNPLVKIEA